MFLVYDNATNNVLAEYDTYHEAEQRRIHIVGMNPMLATAIEIMDEDLVDERYLAEQSAAHAQPV